jgi:signal transduction histidine kinase
MRITQLHPPIKLWMRIAAMMLASVLAIQALDAVVIYLGFPRVIMVYSSHWLARTVEDAALAVFQADTSQRDAVCARLGADNHLHIRWIPEETAIRPRPPVFSRPNLERTRAAIGRNMKGKVRNVTIQRLTGLHGNEIRINVQFQPPGFGKQLVLGAQGSGDRDFPVLGPFRLAIQGLDGSWIMIEPEGTQSLRTRLQALGITLIFAAVLASLLASAMARNLLRPLDRLAKAARKFGETRKVVPIDTAGLREFEVIAQAMNDMQDRIKRFLDERTQMLAAMSHDLRTGLTGLRLDAEDVSNEEAKAHLIEGMEEMERMISATLAFAAGELKNEPVQAIDLSALLISLCDVFADRHYQVTFSGPDRLSAMCQPVAIKRAFTNLIDNAVKYGGWAHVSLSHSGGWATIFIADGGPGIPPEKTGLAFQAFQRLDSSRSRETGGVGLGLTITRDIIQANGGEITLGQPPHGKGLEVKVTLPSPPPGTNGA